MTGYRTSEYSQPNKISSQEASLLGFQIALSYSNSILEAITSQEAFQIPYSLHPW
jgi:hypothetical protein